MASHGIHPPNGATRTDECSPARFSAFFGTVALPGFGHWMIRRTLRGATWFASYAALQIMAAVSVYLRWVVMASVVLMCSALVCWLAAAIDATILSVRLRPRFAMWWVRGVVVVGVWVASSAVSFRVASFVRNHYLEAFVIASNSMMPALIGQSVDGTCSFCGKETPMSASDLRPRATGVREMWRDQPMAICSHCGSELSGSALPDPVPAFRSCDRILVNKKRRPRRWDIAVFRYPEQRDVRYVFRVVGLPGERVELRGGRVSIDGEISPCPQSLGYLNYLNSGVPGEIGWGGDGNAITLGPDEFFVLGDFSARAKDSRLWLTGAPGHPPYAVPAEDIEGVVTHIYWPTDRWRLFE